MHYWFNRCATLLRYVFFCSFRKWSFCLVLNEDHIRTFDVSFWNVSNEDHIRTFDVSFCLVLNEDHIRTFDVSFCLVLKEDHIRTFDVSLVPYDCVRAYRICRFQISLWIIYQDQRGAVPQFQEWIFCEYIQWWWIYNVNEYFVWIFIWWIYNMNEYTYIKYL